MRELVELFQNKKINKTIMELTYHSGNSINQAINLLNRRFLVNLLQSVKMI